MLLLAISATGSRRVTEVGFALALIGAIVLVGAFVPKARRLAVPIAGLLMAIGFLLALIVLHWGMNPYVRHK